MSGKKALGLSVLLCALFSLALLLPSGGGGTEAEIRCLPAGEEARLTGADAPGGEASELLPGELVDINRAGAQELQLLPGIGEVLAGAIVEYRQKNGDFQTIEDIMEVPGIGPARFAAIEGSITVKTGENRQ